MRTVDFAIETRGLTRDFGALRAVDSLDLKVKAGSLYGFLGRNGAGKSTTIKMLTGILEPSRGKMFLLGTDLSDAAAALAVRRRTGVVPEDMALFELLTGREYLTFVGRMYLLSEEILRPRIEELLSVLELGAGHSQLVLEYSHGMRKKLALAAALLPDPDILFLDEPFEGVDAVGSRVMRDILRSHVKRGSTVFVTFHGTNVSGERQRPGTIVPWSTSGAGPQAKPKAPAVGHSQGGCFRLPRRNAERRYGHRCAPSQSKK